MPTGKREAGRPLLFQFLSKKIKSWFQNSDKTPKSLNRFIGIYSLKRLIKSI